MRRTYYLIRAMALFSGVLAAIPVSSRASVTLSVSDYSTLDQVQVGGTVYGTTMENAYIGIYSFAVSANTTGVSLPNTIQSICLSPLGNLLTGPNTYNYETFAAANPGINPNGWAQGTGAQAGQLWGIQNANYLWLKFSSAVETAGDPTAAAALALAMYDALYNSTGYGVIGSTVKNFVPNFISTLEQTDYNADVASLNPAGVNANLATGYVFVGSVPADDGPSGPSGQEFIILSPGETLNTLAPVPEPTTMIAGALLLLPFGAGTLRSLRKKNAE